MKTSWKEMEVSSGCQKIYVWPAKQAFPSMEPVTLTIRNGWMQIQKFTYDLYT